MDLSRYAALFVTESREQLSACSQALLDWEREPAAAEPVVSLFRAMHTFKGMAGAMGFANLTELAHRSETVLDRLRTDPASGRGLFDLFFRVVDALEQGAAQAIEGKDAGLDFTGLLTELGTTDDVVLDLPLYCGDRQHPETRSLEDRLGRRAHQARLVWKALPWIDWDRTRAGDPDSLTDHPMASAYLREARLAHYDLRGSFEAADLIGARFERCDLKDASLAGAVRGTAPDHRTVLHNCTHVPVESFVVEADGKRFIDLRDLDLRGSELEGLPHDLTDLDARGAELSGIDLRDRQLRRARFDGAWLVSARLARIDAHAASFDKAHLGGANLTGAQLIQATFRGAWLDKDDDNTSATLAGSVMDRADFTGAHLYHADLSNVVLDSGILADTELLGVKLSGSDLCHADLGGATITGATFSRACLINAVFRGAVMGHAQSSTTTSFDSAMLQGADFTNATLRGVNLRNAVLATKPGHFLVTKRVRGRRIELKMEHGATILPAELTTHNVICPNGDRDDCTVTTWTIHDPPTSWKGE